MRTSLSSISSLILVAALSVTPRLAYADDLTNKTLAQALFDEAVKLMETGKVAEACKKFEDSDRLFQGIGTRIRLGECFEKSGRHASAWTSYRGALSLAETKGDARAADLRERIAALTPRLSHLQIDVPVASRVAGLKISRDNSEIPEGLWGVPAPVDGGTHVIEASAPGKNPWKNTVSVKSEKDVVVLPVPLLTVSAVVVSQKTTSDTAPEAKSSGVANHGSAVETHTNKGGAQRAVGYVLGGLGAAGMVFGGVELLGGKSKQNSIDSQFPDGCITGTAACDSLHSLENERDQKNTMGFVGLAVGGAFVIAGVVVIVTAPSNQAATRVAGGVSSSNGRTVFSVTGMW